MGEVMLVLFGFVSSGSALAYVKFGYDDYKQALATRERELEAVKDSVNAARAAEAAEITANDVEPYTPGNDNDAERVRQEAVNKLDADLADVGVADVQRCGDELMHEIAVAVLAPTRPEAMAANARVSSIRHQLIDRLGELNNRTERTFGDYIDDKLRVPAEDPGGAPASCS